MINKEDYYFLKTHEWVKFIDENTALCGISEYAQNSLGDIVYISLPEVSDSATAGESFCDVESVKAVSEVFAPISGEITAVNTELEDAPELLNEKPLESWIIQVKGTFDKSNLLDYAAYQELLNVEG
jgi:glycine cleavage system H protein